MYAPEGNVIKLRSIRKGFERALRFCKRSSPLPRKPHAYRKIVANADGSKKQETALRGDVLFRFSLANQETALRDENGNPL